MFDRLFIELQLAPFSDTIDAGLGGVTPIGLTRLSQSSFETTA